MAAAIPSKKESKKKPLGCRECRPCISHGYRSVGAVFPCNCRLCEQCLEKSKCSHGVPHGAFSRADGTDKGWCRVCYDSGERSYSESHARLHLGIDASEKQRLEKKAARKAEREAQQEKASKKAALSIDP